jgi:hypothetical protein
VIFAVSKGSGDVVLSKIDLVVCLGHAKVQRRNISKEGPNKIGGSVEQSLMLLIAVAQGSGRKQVSWMRRAFFYR